MSEIIYYDEKNEKKVWKENVSDEEIEEIFEIEKFLKDIMFAIDYYNIVIYNFFDLMNNVINYEFNNKENGFVKLNQYFMNVLNSFYVYIEFYEENYKGKYKKHFSAQYDKYDTYKIVYELRKYTTHCFLAITTINYKIFEQKIEFIISPKEMLKRGTRLKNEIKNILNKKVAENKVIELKKLIFEFFNIFEELQQMIMEDMKNDISIRLEKIEQYVFGENMDKKETYIIKDNQMLISTSRILFSFLNKFSQEYKFSPEFLDVLKKLEKECD